MSVAPLRNLFSAALPRPTARSPRLNREIAVRRLLVLCNGPNPTFSYYLEERLRRTPLPTDIRNLNESLDDVDPEGVFVIVCRYIRPRQLLWLLRHRTRLAGISLLIDDDIPATVADKGGTFAYKAYLTAMGIAPIPILNQVLSDIWVSTPHLARTLGKDRVRCPIVLPPYPPADMYTPSAPRKDGDKITMAFHASGNHDSEHEFLIPIVRDALTRCANLYFEVAVSGRRLERLWMKAELPLERFNLKPHRNWVQYLHETKHQSVDILLVPLLQNVMNDARSNTKRFDSARMGAASIFSRGHVYGESASAGEILIENDHRVWLETIVRLADDAELRRKVKNATEAAIRTCLAGTLATLPLDEDKQKFWDHDNGRA